MTLYAPVSSVGVDGKHRSHHHYESSLMSSDLDTTTFLESEDDASSRITATTGNRLNSKLDWGLLDRLKIKLGFHILFHQNIAAYPESLQGNNSNDARDGGSTGSPPCQERRASPPSRTPA